MKENSNIDNLAIAWQYPGQVLEVIPARYSRMTRPNTWPATCLEDYDCDDGLWCNGTFSNKLFRFDWDLMPQNGELQLTPFLNIY